MTAMQIQQAKKEKDPVYALVAEKGVPRRREFIMQVGIWPRHFLRLLYRVTKQLVPKVVLTSK